MNKTTDIHSGKGFGFLTEDGRVFMQRCFECGRENWAPAVASGQCAWCGYKATIDDDKKKERD
jgi:ribosomal protein L37E